MYFELSVLLQSFLLKVRKHLLYVEVLKVIDINLESSSLVVLTKGQLEMYEYDFWLSQWPWKQLVFSEWPGVLNVLHCLEWSHITKNYLKMLFLLRNTNSYLAVIKYMGHLELGSHNLFFSIKTEAVKEVSLSIGKAKQLDIHEIRVCISSQRCASTTWERV